MAVRDKYSRCKVIKDVDGDSYYILESYYIKEYDLEYYRGKNITLEPGYKRRLILTDELKKLILATINEPMNKMCSLLHMSTTFFSNLRRRCQDNPYDTWQQWVKNGCVPEKISFFDSVENPQTIYDFFGKEHVLLAAEKQKNGQVIFRGFDTSLGKKDHGNGKFILTPELAQFIRNKKFTAAKPTSELSISNHTVNVLQKRIGVSYVKSMRSYLTSNAHLLLSDHPKIVYEKIKEEGKLSVNAVRHFQKKVGFIRKRMKGQIKEDNKFIELLQKASENEDEKDIRKYIEYQESIDENIPNMIETYHVLKDSGIWHFFEDLIESGSPKIKYPYATSENEFVEDVYGKFHKVKKVYKDKTLGIDIYYGFTEFVGNNPRGFVLTEELAEKIRQTMDKPQEFFKECILDKRKIYGLRHEVFNNPYPTAQDWIDAKDRPPLVWFYDKHENPQYIFDYKRRKYLLWKAKDAVNVLLFYGTPVKKLKTRKAQPVLIITRGLVAIFEKYRYSVKDSHKFIPLDPGTVKRIRNKELGFDIIEDNRRIYIDNYKFIYNSEVDEVLERFPYTAKDRIKIFKMQCRVIRRLVKSNKKEDKRIIAVLDQYVNNKNEKSWNKMKTLLPKHKLFFMHLAYEALKKAGEI